MVEEVRIIPDYIYDITISSQSRSNPSSSIEPTLSSMGLSSFYYGSENSDKNNRVGSHHIRPI